MDFLDGLDEAIDRQSLPVIKGPKRETALALPNPPDQEARLDAIIDRVFDKHVGVLEAAGDWADLEFDKDGKLESPPSEWIERYGPREAMRRFRIARAALCPTKDAPVGLKLSQTIVTSMIKAKAKAPSQQTLNVNVFLPSPNIGATVEDSPYPIIDVRADDE